jgi:hypothetical protein
MALTEFGSAQVSPKLHPREEQFRIPSPRRGLSLFLRYLPPSRATELRRAVVYVLNVRGHQIDGVYQIFSSRHLSRSCTWPEDQPPALLPFARTGAEVCDLFVGLDLGPLSCSSNCQNRGRQLDS